ncbi:hypothetical protein [Streptomyces sp. CRN 30]|uniref:hypothetical protein n=1 Tax=Streptomyces sp. CRN 30 TaxID=3075613 RepID=UPI002A7F3FAB|nr:hypothetical protein [Streptomyces sp. CRN 30]
MDATITPAAILAEQLAARGLYVTYRRQHAVSVVNPLHPGLGETVTAHADRYLTEDGYEIGEHGDEHATADRVVFLLGLPRVVVADGRKATR